MILIHLLIMRSEFVTQTDFQKNIRMFLKDVSTIAFIMRIEFYICICFPDFPYKLAGLTNYIFKSANEACERRWRGFVWGFAPLISTIYMCL